MMLPCNPKRSPETKIGDMPYFRAGEAANYWTFHKEPYYEHNSSPRKTSHT